MSEVTEKGKLVVLSGPSGCGKDTVLNRLCEMDRKFRPAVSATTRAPREGELEGVHYYFISKEEFERRIAEGDFVEYVQYNGNYYGTLKSEIDTAVNAGFIIVLVIEVQGAANIIAQFPDAESVFLMPPSMGVLEQRLRNRGTESEETILDRLDIAKKEMEKSRLYKHVVVNDDLDKTVRTVHDILTFYTSEA